LEQRLSALSPLGEEGCFRAAVSDDPDLEYALIDGTIVSVHQKASSASGETKHQAIGRSKGGP
jgi:hypothetical protein